ncbi:MAG: hypothetical protein ACLFV7_10900 [Phycisphaerae bacterium]
MSPFRLSVLAALLVAFLVSMTHAAEPWPKEIKGHEKVKRGEHPRLLFRQSDLPALRAKMKTTEGKAILKRLGVVLNGRDGKTMPKSMGHGPGDGSKFASPFAAGGTFTISHVAGYGLLYQLTGDKLYADLGRKAMDAALAGYRGVDKRYSFKNPSGALRAGPSLGWYAVGYDLCYDGWDEDYRTKIGKIIANYNEGRNMSLPELVRGSRHHPGSNHWGMQVGGGAMAMLAVLGDPGVDDGSAGRARPGGPGSAGDPGVDDGSIEKLIKTSEKAMIRNATEGFGDGGYFREGDGTGSMASHIIYLAALQAWRNVLGKDFITPRPNVQWMHLRWILGTVVKNGKLHFHSRDGYPHNVWDRDGISGGAYFGTGFGVATPAQKAGYLWFYNEFLKERDIKKDVPFDTVGIYPHQSTMAYVNWPVGLEPVNPAECMPRASVDHKYAYLMFRNEWKDQNDFVVTVLAKRPRKHTKHKVIGPVTLTAYGKDFTWGSMKGDVKHFTVMQDGCATATTADGTSIALDWTGRSGAEGMLVMTGPGAPGKNTVKAGDVTYSFLFLTKGKAPAPKADGDKVRVGTQVVSVKDGNLVLENTAGPWDGPTQEAKKAVANWKK